MKLRTFILSFLAFFILAIPLFASSQNNQFDGKVTNDDVISALESFINSSDTYSGIPFRIYSKQVMDTITADGTLEVKIFDKAREGLLKSDNFQATITTNGKTIKRYELRSYIGIEVPVATAKCDLKRGERLDGSYAFKWRDLSSTSVRMPVYEGENLVDQVLKVNIRAGREIDKNLLEMPYLVFRGDKVRVVLSSGSLMLSMTAKALESGKMGDSIEILNETSGKRITARVTGDGEVSIK
jgi:flagella basal body P-ring formation protein FlgA